MLTGCLDKQISHTERETESRERDVPLLRERLLRETERDLERAERERDINRIAINNR